MATSARILTALLGIALFRPGVTKFFEPFRTMFAAQITLSELPFPALSYWAGQLSELVVGFTLLSLAVMWNRIPSALASRIFLAGHLMVLPIMAVATYVHLHPDVPAIVLPFGHKPPYLAVAVLLMASVNLYLYQSLRVGLFSATRRHGSTSPTRRRWRGDVSARRDHV